MTTTTYSVTGMTCDHCVSAVSSELTAMDGVHDVSIDLVVDGTSTVTVSSDVPLSAEQVDTALDEAGSYRLAPTT